MLEQIGPGGILWLSITTVLVCAALTASFRAYHDGREPGLWTVKLPEGMLLASVAFVLVWAIVRVDPASDVAPAPIQVPEWIFAVFADSTAMTAALSSGLLALTWATCQIVRGRVLHQQGVDVDDALLQEERGQASEPS